MVAALNEEHPVITQNIVNFLCLTIVFTYFTLLNMLLALQYAVHTNNKVPLMDSPRDMYAMDTIGCLVIPIALNHLVGVFKLFNCDKILHFYQIKACVKVTVFLIALFGPFIIYNSVRIMPIPSLVTLYYFSIMTSPIGILYALSAAITRSNHKFRSIWTLLPLYILFCILQYLYVSGRIQVEGTYSADSTITVLLNGSIFFGYSYVVAEAIYSKIREINADRKLRGHEVFIIQGAFAYYSCRVIIKVYSLVQGTSASHATFGSAEYISPYAVLVCSAIINFLNFDLFKSLTRATAENNAKANELVAVQALVKKLERETSNNAKLLHRILPPSVARQLCAGKPVRPEYYDSSSIFFSDIEGFTSISSHCSPLEVINFLNHMYTVMDYIASLFNLYKVETIGDAYVIASGIPDKFDDHALEIANFALLVMHCINIIKNPANTSMPIRLRVGINTGSAVCGVVGTSMPRYCIFGNTINVASRMETTGIVDRIHVSAAFANLLQTNYPGWFLIEERGEVEIKGKGLMTTYWINGAGPANTKITADFMAKTRSKVKRILNEQKDKPLVYNHLFSPLRELPSDGLPKKLSKLNLLLADLDNEIQAMSPKSKPSTADTKSLISPVSVAETDADFDDMVDIEYSVNAATSDPDLATDAGFDSDIETDLPKKEGRMHSVQHGKWDNGLTFFLVDDSETIVKITTRVLQNQGHKVHHAKNGEEAIQLLHKLKMDNMVVDIVLLDDDMPIMDGTSCTMALRFAGFDGLIIGLTGHMNSSFVKAVTYCLPKPLCLETLRSVVASSFEDLSHIDNVI